MGKNTNRFIGATIGFGAAVCFTFLATEQYEQAEKLRHRPPYETVQRIGNVTINASKHEGFITHAEHAVEGFVHFVGDQKDIVNNFFNPGDTSTAIPRAHFTAEQLDAANARGNLSNAEGAAILAVLSFGVGGTALMTGRAPKVG